MYNICRSKLYGNNSSKNRNGSAAQFLYGKYLISCIITKNAKTLGKEPVEG